MPSPIRPAFSPWSSACWPSVAETVDWLISASLIGSAPIFSTSARSWASCAVTPEIWAPVRPSIPFGLSTKLMIGFETSSPSRTIANEPENWSASAEEIPPQGGAGGGEAIVARRAGRCRR